MRSPPPIRSLSPSPPPTTSLSTSPPTLPPPGRSRLLFKPPIQRLLLPTNPPPPPPASSAHGSDPTADSRAPCSSSTMVRKFIVLFRWLMIDWFLYFDSVNCGVAEILDFCEFISPTQEEQAARAAAVQRVFGVVKYIWPHCNVWVLTAVCFFIWGLIGFIWLWFWFECCFVGGGVWVVQDRTLFAYQWYWCWWFFKKKNLTGFCFSSIVVMLGSVVLWLWSLQRTAFIGFWSVVFTKWCWKKPMDEGVECEPEIMRWFWCRLWFWIRWWELRKLVCKQFLGHCRREALPRRCRFVASIVVYCDYPVLEILCGVNCFFRSLERLVCR